MSLDTRPPRQSPVRQVATPRERDAARGLPSRSLLVALVLACVALMVVDRTSGDESPVEPVRRVVGEVIGPAQAWVRRGESQLAASRRTSVSRRIAASASIGSPKANPCAYSQPIW